MASKDDCGNHGERRRIIMGRIVGGILILLFLVLLAILLIWAILRPRKPTFVLEDATVFVFTVSSASASAPYYVLNATLGVTVSSRNPNRRIGIYYDRLHVYASYRNQQVTLRTRIDAPGYQGHKETNVWSPFLYSPSVPLAPSNGAALSLDYRNSGPVPLAVKLDGRIRWKVGGFISTTYHLHVTCPAYLTHLAPGPPPTSSSSSSSTAANGIARQKYQLTQKCGVNV